MELEELNQGALLHRRGTRREQRMRAGRHCACDPTRSAAATAVVAVAAGGAAAAGGPPAAGAGAAAEHSLSASARGSFKVNGAVTR
jgi:hypothetical protein